MNKVEIPVCNRCGSIMHIFKVRVEAVEHPYSNSIPRFNRVGFWCPYCHRSTYIPSHRVAGEEVGLIMFEKSNIHVFHIDRDTWESIKQDVAHVTQVMHYYRLRPIQNLELMPKIIGEAGFDKIFRTILAYYIVSLLYLTGIYYPSILEDTLKGSHKTAITLHNLLQDIFTNLDIIHRGVYRNMKLKKRFLEILIDEEIDLGKFHTLLITHFIEGI